MSETGSATKRHNPVDSICRKIKTIQMRDQESNPHMQIPKFQSRNFDSPQSSTKKNLEEVLKNRTVKNTERDLVCFSSPNNEFSPNVQVLSPYIRHALDSESPMGNVASSVSLASKEKVAKVWPSCRTQSCSTPMVFSRDRPFKFSQTVLPISERIIPSAHSFYFTDPKSEPLALQSPVVKRLSMSEAGLRRVADNKAEAASEVSLICEEDLLDSIFYACDTEHRGKVAVSKIVDYLRHTTSRGSEDSGLDELCNMLDPERQDISMDLDTYHAIMKEWIDDCRNNGTTDNKMKDSILGAEDSMFKLREGLLAVRRISGTLNITSGSLEAFGGDISRGDLETSDLITCVADLQYNNQKLQDQQHKLKTTIEALEETNHRLLEENEELHSQWRSAQQSVTKARILKDELEEMKISLSSSEEKKAQMVSQNKQLEKDNLSLVHKITSLQEENMRNMLEADMLRKTIKESNDKIAVLQLQLNEADTNLQKKDAHIHMKALYIEEQKTSLREYMSVIENLRIEKAKLESNLQQMEQELLSNGIASPVTYKLNRIIAGGLNSLHSELELAQQSPEVSGVEWVFPTGGHTSALDVTLDREVLLMFQGPGHEQMAAEFKVILQTLEDTCDMSDLVLPSLQSLIDSSVCVTDLPGKMLEIIKLDLKEKRNIWSQKLNQLERHKESLDKEFVKMAGNLRRMKTEQLHLRKELSSRLHELETVRQQREEAEETAGDRLNQLEELDATQETFTKQIQDLGSALTNAWTEAEYLRRSFEEAVCEQRRAQAENQTLTSERQIIQDKSEAQQKTIHSLQEKLFQGQLCGLLCQTCLDWNDAPPATIKAPEPQLGEKKKRCFYKTFGIQETIHLARPHKKSPLPGRRCVYTPLLDALTLEILQLCPRRCRQNFPCAESRSSPESEGRVDLSNSGSLNKCGSVSQGVQTDVDYFIYPAMEGFLPEEHSDGHPATRHLHSSDLNSHSATDGVSSPSLENTLVSSEPDSEPCVMAGHSAASLDMSVRGLTAQDEKAGEVGPWEDGTRIVGPWEDGTRIVGPWEDGTRIVGPWEDRTRIVGPWEDGTRIVGPWEDRTRIVGPWEDRTRIVGPWEDGTRMAGPWEDGTRIVGPWEDGTPDGRTLGGWDPDGGTLGGWEPDGGTLGGWDPDSGSLGGWDPDGGTLGGWDPDSGSLGGWEPDGGTLGGWDPDGGTLGGWDPDSGSLGGWEPDGGTLGGWDPDGGTLGGWDPDGGTLGGWDPDGGTLGGWDPDGGTLGGWDPDGGTLGGWEPDGGTLGGWDPDGGTLGGWDSDGRTLGGWDPDGGTLGGWDPDSGTLGGWDPDGGTLGGWDPHNPVLRGDPILDSLPSGDAGSEVKTTDQPESAPCEEIVTTISQTNSVNTTVDENHCLNSEKEMETEFLRLSLGFKCDLFTLDKRLRLEERSRDLAEGNLKKEIAGCVKLLEALTPLCEEDNQMYEIVKKLEKSLQFLTQHSARVASRAEMLGAIHQESRVSKAVEVMIQHVENLKRMYAKEHAELEELKELIQQNEPPRSAAERDDLHKLPSSLITKPTALRRVSMPAYPRGMVSGSAVDSFGTDKSDGKMHKRSNSWKVVGSKPNDNRPILQRFVANYTRGDPTEENFIQEDETSAEIMEDLKEEIVKSPETVLSPTEKGSMCKRVKLWALNLKSSVFNLNKPVLVSILAIVLLSALVSFLTGLSFQQPVDGAPAGTGNSWTSLQQFLWPYTGLHHNGQPPV
ncbi:inositol 1,4,5-triphosphate receptor associated 2 [Pelodytes ibericus]